MGRPAARLLDNTVHGGVIVMGDFTVIIGNRPAARVGDNHVCPIPTHVGGPIIPPAALNTLISNRPASRIGDQAICAGPPDIIATGEVTVLIGTGVAVFTTGLPFFKEKLIKLISIPTAHYWKKVTGQLFVDGPSAFDVVQGMLGDCYLMASLSAVAGSRPELIEKMVTVVDEPSNLYQVTMTLPDGTATSAIVSGEVPGFLGAASYGGSSQSKETWVAIAEKGYAALLGDHIAQKHQEYWKEKHKGGYDGIGHGWYPDEALSHITGGESRSYDTGSTEANERAWSALEEGTAQKKPMTAGSKGKREGMRKVFSPVIGNHAYTVLGARTDSSGQRWVDLRNPHGKEGVAGRIMSGGKAGGTFSMRYESFCKDFDRVDVNDPP